MTVTLADLYRDEYVALKAEQNGRLNTRDTLIFATLTAIAVTSAFALTSGRSDVLLALPGGVLVLGWLFFGNDRKIAYARIYLRDDLRPRMAAELGGDVTAAMLWRWETPGRMWGLQLWRLGGLWFDLGLFVAPPAAVLSWWAATRWAGTFNPLAVVWLMFAASTLLMVVAAVASTLARRPVVKGIR